MTTLWPEKEYDCMFGDFNARSALWDDTVLEDPAKGNKRGELVEEWLAGTSMSYLNTGEATHISRIDNSPSAPDISFVHSSMSDRWDWKVLPRLGSNHHPIAMT